MSDLFSSLRSFLPNNNVEGKSSVYDDLEEATKYIKDLEKNVKQLQEKRDKLKNSPEKQQEDVVGSSSGSTVDRTVNGNCVNIHTFPKRLEIEISVKVGEEDAFPLSKVLKQVVLEQGLEVVSCLSSKVDDEIWNCVVHCDMVNDEPMVDYSQLQRRLTSEITSYAS